MKDNNQDLTAILVFANSAQEDSKLKRISGGAGLFDGLTNHTLASVKKSKMTYFHISEEQQIGDSFGTRFSNAIQSVFDKGFKRIITIGNDSPHLTTAHLIDAQFHLEKGKTVIGPSADGGFYLIGLKKEQFNASDFEKLSWNTSKITTEVTSLISRQSELVRLKTLFDVDSMEDLQLMVSRFQNFSNYLFKIFLSVLKVQSVLYIIDFALPKNHLSFTYFNKGSPGLLHF